MAKKSNHKHDWVRCLKYVERPNWPYRYDLVVKCSICGRVKPASYKDSIVKIDGSYRYLITYEELIGQYGDMEVITDS